MMRLSSSYKHEYVTIIQYLTMFYSEMFYFSVETLILVDLIKK